MFVDVQGPWNPWIGRLGMLLDMEYTNPFIFFALVLVVVGALAVAAYLVYSRRVGWLWREWLTTVDHKKIGIMYVVVGLVMLFRGFFDAIMIRTHQAMAAGTSSPGIMGAQHGYMPPFHMDQVFTAHGTIMIIVAVTPILVGLMNILVPLQIGARDMAYPFLNAVGLAFTVAASALIMGALFIGFFSHAGWVGLAPLTEMPSSPGPGVDYWIWAIQLSSIGTTLGALNIIATILKMRAPGMTLLRMPVFSWAALGTNIIALTSFPLLTVAVSLLTLDRYIGTHFFTADGGGNLMMYTNLFWLWGHPEVYFVVLPAFGMISEIIPTFSEKTLFNYVSMVFATMAIAGVSWLVWLHHYYIMGASAGVNTFFSIATMLVGIPTGVKVFNWVFTMWRGHVRLETPMLWAVTAVLLLIGGGMTGMMVAIPAINYVTHNSVFVVAHFHNMFLIIVFAVFGGVTYWWPKMFGFKLDEYLGRWFFWLFWGGSVFVFVPMYVLGFLGMTRRLDFIAHSSWLPLLLFQVVGIVLYTASVLVFLLQLYVSIRDRHENRVTGPDAWETSRSLEWATHTPPPFYNFAVQPVVHERDEWAWRRENGLTSLDTGTCESIHMPKNSAIPALLCVLGLVFGFAMVWRIWWLAGVSLVGVVIAVIVRGCIRDIDYTVPAAEVERIEKDRLTVRDDEVARQPAPAPGDNAHAGRMSG
ncbi:cbb3-type cytochrome c oxidase subunit I [Salinisphaera orenii]|uniref:cbb3-type cytochrome c oxidase subunit I n=1 Tax=Salinisphaera orenii TaxID=856731 RepID=UPI000DBE207F